MLIYKRDQDKRYEKYGNVIITADDWIMKTCLLKYVNVILLLMFLRLIKSISAL